MEAHSDLQDSAITADLYSISFLHGSSLAGTSTAWIGCFTLINGEPEPAKM